LLLRVEGFVLGGGLGGVEHLESLGVAME
jgi:hypothetical protein